jgi:replicative DNA helicase
MIITALANHEAEMATLGAMILSADAITEVRAILKPEHFHVDQHGKLFALMIRMADQGHAVDLLTLRNALGERYIKEVGGIDSLISMAEIVPSASNARFYAQLVADASERRALLEQAQALAKAACDETITSSELRAQASSISEAGSSGPAPFIHLGDVDIAAPDRGFSTGFKSLDGTITTGGYPEGQMTVVRAYHKGGKSTFMVTSFVEAAKAGHRVLYATFADLSAKQLKRRMVRQLSGWGRQPDDVHDLEHYMEALAAIRDEWQGFVYDASAMDAGSDVETFCAWLKAEHRREPFEMVWVDYAQELSSSDKKATNEVSEQNICASKIARLAATTGAPIAVGSQVTEASAPGQKAKTKYSRAWEEKAGWVLTLEREGEENATAEVTYSRFGPQGIKVPLKWNGYRLRFEERAA